MPNSVTKRFRVEGLDEYQFHFLYEPNGTYSIWCWEHPHDPYQKGATVTHLYPDGRVCVTAGKEPRTLDRAVAIAHVFMRAFSNYVRTGAPGRTGGRVNV